MSVPVSLPESSLINDIFLVLESQPSMNAIDSTLTAIAMYNARSIFSILDIKKIHKVSSKFAPQRSVKVDGDCRFGKGRRSPERHALRNRLILATVT